MEKEDKFLDRFTERYKYFHFLYAKNDQYKVVDLKFGKNGPSYPSIDILIFDYNKLKREDDMKITYPEKLRFLCKGYQGPSSQKKYIFGNNVNWFFRYGVENICKSDESY